MNLVLRIAFHLGLTDADRADACKEICDEVTEGLRDGQCDRSQFHRSGSVYGWTLHDDDDSASQKNTEKNDD